MIVLFLREMVVLMKYQIMFYRSQLNLSQWRSNIKLVENGAGIISLKIFIGYIDSNERNSQYVHFRCGRIHIINSLKKIRVSYKSQLS